MAILIDLEKCNGCMLCLEICALGNFERGNDGKVHSAEGPSCFACGHCVAVCPTGAMSHSALDSSGFEALDASARPTFEQFLKFLKIRRSRREFKPDRVPRSEVEKLLLAAVEAPSSLNNQSVEYTVVTNPAALEGISERAAMAVTRMARMMKNPLFKGFIRLTASEMYESIVPFVPLMDWMLELQAQGRDMMIYDAPCLILLHAPKWDICAPMDAVFNAENILLAAETLGLGACVIGFVFEPMNKDAEMKRLAGIPKDHKVFSAIALGYPRFKYRASPPKNAPITHWKGMVDGGNG